MEKVNIKYVVPDPNQPRKAFDAQKLGKLKKSIEKYGIINPLVVEKISDTKYLLVDGERRFRTALAIGLKEIPVNIVKASDEVDRLIRQFHIQEQQEGWSPIEKANVLFQLSDGLEMGVTKACELLGIPQRTANRYIAYAQLIEKDQFERDEVPFQMVTSVVQVRNLAKKISAEELEEKFTRTDEKKMERALIHRITNGELDNMHSFAKIKDSFVKDPKSIKKFMENEDLSVKKMFHDTNAEVTHHLRNMQSSIRTFMVHSNAYDRDPSVRPSVELTNEMKRAIKVFQKYIA